MPRLDREVRTLLPGPSADTVYVGGRFIRVGGAAQQWVALLSLNTGAPLRGFAPRVDGPVYDLAVHPSGRLLIGGTFTRVGGDVRGGLASVDRHTGALDDYLTVRLAGHHNWDGDGPKAPVGVTRFALSPSGARLVLIGNFRTANGWKRDQIVVIDTGSDDASVSAWQTDATKPACATHRFDSWARDVAYSPGGS